MLVCIFPPRVGKSGALNILALTFYPAFYILIKFSSLFVTFIIFCFVCLFVYCFNMESTSAWVCVCVCVCFLKSQTHQGLLRLSALFQSKDRIPLFEDSFLLLYLWFFCYFYKILFPLHTPVTRVLNSLGLASHFFSFIDFSSSPVRFYFAGFSQVLLPQVFVVSVSIQRTLLLRRLLSKKWLYFILFFIVDKWLYFSFHPFLSPSPVWSSTCRFFASLFNALFQGPSSSLIAPAGRALLRDMFLPFPTEISLLIGILYPFLYFW